ncbi:hypothetical protein B5X24_HaOG208985, partial [Helicoverpa armigera]
MFENSDRCRSTLDAANEEAENGSACASLVLGSSSVDPPLLSRRFCVMTSPLAISSSVTESNSSDLSEQKVLT